MTIKYHPNGLWVEQMNDTEYRVGLSEKGQDDVGEVMFVEVSAKTGPMKKGDAILNVEGAKAVTEFTVPFDLTVKEVHQEIEDEPELLNDSEKETNWIMIVTELAEKEFDLLKTDAFSD
ncbi:MAG: glycine cleavage system protein H [Alkalibacterium sp.]|nr:glycine cleavage system protein H [Alkalibacterium sp.]